MTVAALHREARLRIPPAADGQPLLGYLTTRFTYHDATRWTAAIADGRILVNGQPATLDSRLCRDDLLEYRVPDTPEPTVCRDLHTVCEDADLLMVDKPAGLPCHPGGRFFANTLWHILRVERGVPLTAIINRLDRETSGLVLLAKSAAAEKSLRRQFARRQVTKTYAVLVEGVFPDNLSARGWLEPDTACEVRKKRRFVTAVAGDPGTVTAKVPDGEWAETAFRCLHRENGLSLLAAVPHTGRQHQIRATLCSLGYPVVGDKLYGLDPIFFLRFVENVLTAADLQRLRLSRQALHAWQLDFHHPLSGQALHCSAPIPMELLALVPAWHA